MVYCVPLLLGLGDIIMSLKNAKGMAGVGCVGQYIET
jgi:hypothetical protein